MAISTVSFNTVSEIAIVPDSECSTPTLMVSCAWAMEVKPRAQTVAASAVRERRVNFIGWHSCGAVKVVSGRRLGGG